MYSISDTFILIVITNLVTVALFARNNFKIFSEFKNNFENVQKKFDMVIQHKDNLIIESGLLNQELMTTNRNFYETIKKQEDLINKLHSFNNNIIDNFPQLYEDEELPLIINKLKALEKSSLN